MLVDLALPCSNCGHGKGDATHNGKWLDISCARCGEALGSRLNPDYKPMSWPDRALFVLAICMILYTFWYRK